MANGNLRCGPELPTRSSLGDSEVGGRGWFWEAGHNRHPLPVLSEVSILAWGSEPITSDLFP